MAPKLLRCCHLLWDCHPSIKIALLVLATLALPGSSGAPYCPRVLAYKDPFPERRLPGAEMYRVCLLPDWSSSSKDGQIFQVSITAQSQGFVWQGWGTSFGPMSRFLGSLRPRLRHCMANLLFNQKWGLGLNMVRYVIPGGYHPTYSPAQAQSILAARGFWPFPNMKWNSKGDLLQMLFLSDAKRAGASVFEAVSYSPPWWMTYSWDTAGSVEHRSTNLKPQFRALYAKYLRMSMNFVEKTAGIRFDGISPFNEPIEGWWVTGRSKNKHVEGCNFRTSDIDAFLPVLRNELGDKRMVGGVDSWYQSTMRASVYPGTDGSLSMSSLHIIGRFNVHGYWRSKGRIRDDFGALDAMRRVARKYKRPIWQSEWGPLGVKDGNDLDMALYLARKVIQHVNIMGAEAWFFWQAFERLNWHWGAVRARFQWPLKTVYLSKQFFAFQHFTRFMRPHSIPVKVTSPCRHTVLAAYDPRYPRVAITVVNQRPYGKVLGLSLSGYTCLRRCIVDVYRTSASESIKFVGGNLPLVSLKTSYVPAYTVVTFVVRNAYVPKSRRFERTRKAKATQVSPEEGEVMLGDRNWVLGEKESNSTNGSDGAEG